MGSQVTIHENQDCDLCKQNGRLVPATVDGKTAYGPWAFMCDDCFRRAGIGLGTGQGQRLVRCKDSECSFCHPTEGGDRRGTP